MNAATVFAFLVCIEGSAVAKEDFARTTIPFAQLSAETQDAILEIKVKSKQFSEGCSDEKWELGKSVMVHLAADAACAGTAIAAVESAGLASKLAVVSCGIGVPTATVDVYDKYENWKECKEFTSFHHKYREFCDGKGIYVHVYKDALICVSNDLTVPIARIDLSKDKPVVELLMSKD